MTPTLENKTRIDKARTKANKLRYLITDLKIKHWKDKSIVEEVIYLINKSLELEDFFFLTTNDKNILISLGLVALYNLSKRKDIVIDDREIRKTIQRIQILGVDYEPDLIELIERAI